MIMEEDSSNRSPLIKEKVAYKKDTFSIYSYYNNMEPYSKSYQYKVG